MAVVDAGPGDLLGATEDDVDGPAQVAVDRAVRDGADLVELVAAPALGAGSLRHAGELALFVAALRERHPDLTVAVSTSDARAARLVCAAGAGLVNDVTGEIGLAVAEAAVEHGTGIICGYSADGSRRSRARRARHADRVDSITRHLSRQAEALAERGIPRHSIFIDPRHDWEQDTEQALELLRRSARLVATGWPVIATLTGSSFIGDVLGVDAGQERPGTVAATVTAATAGVQVFRTHDVAMTRAVLDLVSSVRAPVRPALS